MNNHAVPNSSTVVASYGGGPTVLLNLSYSFVQAGGINNWTPVSITNNLSSGRTQSFTYDTLNRLATAQSYANSGADCWGQSYAYDRYGNLTNVSSTKCSAPTLSLSVSSSTNQITNTSFAYDNAGNMTHDGGSASYTYTAENQLASTNGITYTQDGDLKRTKKSSGKLYWFSEDGKVLAESDASGNITSGYIYLKDQRIARRDVGSGNVYYFIADSIGNTRVVTDAAGGIVEVSDYYPYGTERVVAGTGANNNYKFIGMERDTEASPALDHTLNRQYSPELARWLSPHPVAGTPGNPQSWNRYPYVLNDPLTLVDPLGTSANPNLVECMPVAASFIDIVGGGYGCWWDPEEDDCPPGFNAIYQSPGQLGPSAIEQAASYRLSQYQIGGLRGDSPWFLSYSYSDGSIHFTIHGDVLDSLVGSSAFDGDISGIAGSREPGGRAGVRGFR